MSVGGGTRGKIAFDDSVILRTAFYHLMFKTNAQSMKRANIQLNLGKAGLILEERIRLTATGSPTETEANA